MRKIIGIAALGVATLAAATALEIGVGAFYAPASVVGYVDEAREYGEKELSPAGFKGRVALSVYEGLYVTAGLGYNNFIYREAPLFTFPETSYVTSIPTLLTTFGAGYVLNLGSVKPFVGAGPALARESVKGNWHESVDWYGGLYAETGARYFVANALALEAGPRYTLLFDKPVVNDDLNSRDFVRSEYHTQLVELLVGINYYF